MRPQGSCYTVVELAGYEGENERRTAFSTSEAAWKWAERTYRTGEIEDLHVQVRRDSADGQRTYEY